MNYTIILVATVSLIAFDGLGISTIAPQIATSLAMGTSYGQIFSIFLLSQLFSATIIIQLKIRNQILLVMGLVIFCTGGLLSAAASQSVIFILGRFIQGIGAGASINAAYQLVATKYTDDSRPKVLAWLTNAWVAPALIGPVISTKIAFYFEWNSIFLIISITGIIITLAILYDLFFNDGFIKNTPYDCINGNHRKPYKIYLPLLVPTGAGLIIYALESSQFYLAIGIGIIGFITIFPGLISTTSIESNNNPNISYIIYSRGLAQAIFVTVEIIQVLKAHSTDSTGFHASLLVSTGAISWAIASTAAARQVSSLRSKSQIKKAYFGTIFISINVAISIFALLIPDLTLSNAIQILGQIIGGIGVGLYEPTAAAIIYETSSIKSAPSIARALQTTDLLFPSLIISISTAIIPTSRGQSLLWLPTLIFPLLASITFVTLTAKYFLTTQRMSNHGNR